MEKVIIAAIADNRVIGKDGDIPWHYPEDMEHFRQKTLGYPVVMGSDTFRSLPDDFRPLPDRPNIVLTRSGIDCSDPDVYEAGSLGEAWNIASGLDDKVFIAGGESVYRQCLGDADRMVITRIHDEFEGDTFFPEWQEDNWEEVSRQDGEELSFVEYVRS